MKTNKLNAFVLMSFDQEFDEVYKSFIAPALEEAGYCVTRADDILSQRNILQDIVASIISCELILADLTASNPNVFYELGLAHGLNKKVIVLTQDIEDLPFDLKPYRVLAYDTHFARIDDAKKKLINMAQGAHDGTVLFASPISDFRVGSPNSVSTIEENNDADMRVEKEDDDRGLLDHIVDLEDDMKRFTDIMSSATIATEDIGNKTTRATAEIAEAVQNKGEGTVANVRKIARKQAKAISGYSKIMSDINQEFSQIGQRMNNSIEFVVGVEINEGDEGFKEFREYLETLSEVEDSACGAKESMESLAQSIKGQIKIEKQLDRASAIASDEVRTLAEYLGQMIASIRRAQEIGYKKIKSHKKEE
jgi:hypothetical protein